MQTMTHYDRSPFRLVYENQLMVIHSRSTNSFVIFFIILSSSICTSGFSSNIIAFGDKKGITLTLDKSSYASLTNIHGNQLSVSVRYQVDDKSLADQKINGLMKIYSSNGTLIHSTSFPSNYTNTIHIQGSFIMRLYQTWSCRLNSNVLRAGLMFCQYSHSL